MQRVKLEDENNATPADVLNHLRSILMHMDDGRDSRSLENDAAANILVYCMNAAMAVHGVQADGRTATLRDPRIVTLTTVASLEMQRIIVDGTLEEASPNGLIFTKE